MHSGLNDLAVGLPHSEIPGSKLGYQLPWAYRRFLRPSSPLDAKTSTVCPLTLGHVDRMPSDQSCSCVHDRPAISDRRPRWPLLLIGPATCLHAPRQRVFSGSISSFSIRYLPSIACTRRAQPVRTCEFQPSCLMHLSQSDWLSPTLQHEGRSQCRVEQFSESRVLVNAFARLIFTVFLQ